MLLILDGFYEIISPFLVFFYCSLYDTRAIKMDVKKFVMVRPIKPWVKNRHDTWFYGWPTGPQTPFLDNLMRLWPCLSAIWAMHKLRQTDFCVSVFVCLGSDRQRQTHKSQTTKIWPNRIYQLIGLHYRS